MILLMGVTLLLLTPLLAAPQFDQNHEVAGEVEGEVADPVAWSDEETTTKHLDLEDPISWSASTEVLDENHAWYRRRRSVEGRLPKLNAAEEKVTDLEAAESVVFMPAHLRLRKKTAHEECRRRHQEFNSRTKLSNQHAQMRRRCNSYCCFPEVDSL